MVQILIYYSMLKQTNKDKILGTYSSGYWILCIVMHSAEYKIFSLHLQYFQEILWIKKKKKKKKMQKCITFSGVHGVIWSLLTIYGNCPYRQC